MLACNQRNLGGRASNQALRGGVLMAGLALVGFFVAGQFGLVQKLGWLVAVPLAAASYLVISGAFGICIVHGLKGNRRADHGREAVLDAVNRTKMRNRALLAVTASIAIGCGFAAAFALHG
ncbi:MAG: hypothetical protein ABJB12_05825 [Pseudomonadota bacterium]